MKTAAAYIRVSDERQDEFSPDSQLKLIRDYCLKNEIDLPEELIFYDDGISAKSAEKRVKFNEMIALAKLKDRPFDMILVWKFSRFARNQEESIVYKSLLRKNGVEVISISEPLSDNPFGGLIERIIEWMDEYYLIRLSDEVRRGMTERAERGLPNVAPPFGYMMISGQYQIVEEEAKIVKKVYAMYLEGKTIKSIAVYLNSLGVRSKYGNPIENRGIEYMLNNPVYAGYLRWNPTGRSSSARVYNNPEDILKKSTHEPIINEETFKKVKEIMEQRKRSHSKYVRINPEGHNYSLRGLVKCNSCGSTLVYSKAANGLQCHKYSKGSCKISHCISLPKLEKMVIQAMKEAVSELRFNVVQEESKIQLSESVGTDYDKLIAKEKLKLERAKNAYQEGADSLSEYKETKAKLLQRIKSLEAEKEEAKKETAKFDVKEFADTVANVIDICEDPTAAPELKNNVLKSVLRKVVLHKPDLKVELFFYI